jgi:uncharacterized membrane protein YcgQ (UPF0703/DUF1980 family)
MLKNTVHTLELSMHYKIERGWWLDGGCAIFLWLIVRFTKAMNWIFFLHFSMILLFSMNCFLLYLFIFNILCVNGHIIHCPLFIMTLITVILRLIYWLTRGFLGAIVIENVTTNWRKVLTFLNCNTNGVAYDPRSKNIALENDRIFEEWG